MNQSIQRAVSLLRSFTEESPELSVGELSRQTGLHKSTVSRMLSTLREEGLVGQNPDSGRYRLGVGLISLAGVALGRLDVRGVAQPHLTALVELSGETVNVTILDGDECVNIERIASPKPIQYVGWIGRRTPLTCTAPGRCLLAFGDGEQLAHTLKTLPVKSPRGRAITLERLQSALAQVRAQGYAIVHEEFEEGYSAIAAPLFDHQRHVVAAVSISGPTFRIGPGNIEGFVGPLLETARTISDEMGFRTAGS